MVANAVKHEQADQQHREPEEENEHELKVVHRTLHGLSRCGGKPT